jgi:hypothetical protein
MRINEEVRRTIGSPSVESIHTKKIKILWPFFGQYLRYRVYNYQPVTGDFCRTPTLIPVGQDISPEQFITFIQGTASRDIELNNFE